MPVESIADANPRQYGVTASPCPAETRQLIFPASQSPSACWGRGGACQLQIPDEIQSARRRAVARIRGGRGRRASLSRAVRGMPRGPGMSGEDGAYGEVTFTLRYERWH